MGKFYNKNPRFKVCHVSMQYTHIMGKICNVSILWETCFYYQNVASTCLVHVLLSKCCQYLSFVQYISLHIFYSVLHIFLFSGGESVLLIFFFMFCYNLLLSLIFCLLCCNFLFIYSLNFTSAVPFNCALVNIFTISLYALHFILKS